MKSWHNNVISKELCKHYSPLTQSEEQDALSLAKCGHIESRDRLWYSLSRLVILLASKNRGFKSMDESLSDLFILFLNCIEVYDSSKGMKFSTYISQKAGWNRIDEIRSSIRYHEQFQVPENIDSLASIDSDEVKTPSISLESLLERIKIDSNEKSFIAAYLTTKNQSQLASNLGCSKQNISVKINRLIHRMNTRVLSDPFLANCA